MMTRLTVPRPLGLLHEVRHLHHPISSGLLNRCASVHMPDSCGTSMRAQHASAELVADCMHRREESRRVRR